MELKEEKVQIKMGEGTRAKKNLRKQVGLFLNITQKPLKGVYATPLEKRS